MAADDSIHQFVECLRSDEDLQRSIKLATSADEVVEAAASRGIEFSSASLVRCFARTLMEGSDEAVVKKFDELGWDAGEILWFLKSLGSGS
ncbi:Nif11-like leader peptide family natural product precursor [Synechococcus sp. CS-1329]|uniref:Nif11-like leader peptide family natural product precursor n=1 Tax=Synechococcus sp. CS-1329 TaxID=2847975 RepID=UPI00223A77FA|nr:Nif11-like leader peptide family natural product precursor [Synechococcus sp. CS-1329]MCT0219594.1 Nif11-like leader peptide family natural product precursor [Synechococcus sp. CS-1329]